MNKRIALDLVMLIVYLVAAFPIITGIPVHEWVGIIATLVLVAHCAMRGMMSGGPKKETRGVRTFRIVLNILIGFSLAACAVSGIMVSGTVLPAFNLFATGYYFWDPLHALSAKILLALLFVHVALNSDIIMRMRRAKQIRG